MNIAYFGFDVLYNCLELLASSNHKIISIYTYPCDEFYTSNKRVCEIAANLKCPVYFTKPSIIDLDNLYSQGCDLIVSAGYIYKIPIHPHIKGINIHPTMLPNGKGCWPFPHIILNGFKENGVTIHKLSEKFDSGDILFQKSYPVSVDENLESLTSKTQIMSKFCLDTVMCDFNYYWENAIVQGEGTYWKMPEDSHRTINFNEPIKKISKIIRAFGKFESFAYFDNKKWLVQDGYVWEQKHEYEPGEVIVRSHKEIVLSALDGFVCFRFFEIHPEYMNSRFDGRI